MEAVVFDLDGVVVNTEKYWNRAEEKIYREAAGEKIDTEELAGMSIKNSYQHLTENFDIKLSYEEFFQLYEKRARKLYMEKASLMPNFHEIAEKLRDRGLKIGLATGSYWPDYVIERFDLEFDAVSHSGLVDGKGKPEPETYELALEKLGVSPEDAVAVEDTDAGISSAKGAGLYCIGFEGSKGQSLEAADEIVKGSEELEARLLEIID